MDINSLLENKTIALVGPSKSIINSGFGEEIERHDLVVRLNHQWPINNDLKSDVGERMDILYHCCNPDFSMMRFSIPEFQKTKMVFYEQGIQDALLRMICLEYKIPCMDITAEYQTLQHQLNTFPNTGLVAIRHLLSFSIRSLKLFGITFFQEPYYEGYLGNGANAKHWENGTLPKKIDLHQLDVQFAYFLKYFINDSRLAIDQYSHEIMGI